MFGVKKKNRDLSKSLRELGKGIHGTNRMTDEELWQYFIKTGYDYKGQVQTYYNSTGHGMTGKLKIDAVALGLACAGIPAGSFTPLTAEGGGSLSVARAAHTLLLLSMGPAARSDFPICLAALNGWFIDTKIRLEAEVGVKTPEIPGLPKTPEDQAGIASFSIDIGASASASAGVSLGGRYLYAEDSSPRWYNKDIAAVMRKDFMAILQTGSSKGAVKKAALNIFDSNPKIKKYKPRRGIHAITGGGIPTKTIINRLERAIHSLGNTNLILSAKLEQNIIALRPWLSKADLKGYCFVSLWGGHAQGDMGVQAKATAKVKAGFDEIVKGEGGVSLEVQGPKLDASLKHTVYRFQTCSKPNKKLADVDIRRNRNIQKIKKQGAIPLVGLAREISSAPKTLVQTQDTMITYGQINFTLIKAQGGLGASLEQSVFDPGERIGKKHAHLKDEDMELEVEGELESEWGGKSLKGKTKVTGKIGVLGSSIGSSTEVETNFGFKGGGELESKIGPGGISSKASVSAGFDWDLLNYMQYTSAVVYWEIPDDPSAKTVKTCAGSGYAFGQSVVYSSLIKNSRIAFSLKSSGQKKKNSFISALATSLRVSYNQFLNFLEDSFIYFEGLEADPGFKPEALLIESTFRLPVAKPVPVKYREGSGKYILGPKKGKGSLRKIIIPTVKMHKIRDLQSIRLRFRLSEQNDNSKCLFSLGFKYIAEVGISLQKVDKAGAEGIFDITTWWSDSQWRQNETQSYEKGVPPVALLHQ